MPTSHHRATRFTSSEPRWSCCTNNQEKPNFWKSFIASAHFVAHSVVSAYSFAHHDGRGWKRSPGFSHVCKEVQSLIKANITKLKTRQLSGVLARSKPQRSAKPIHSFFRTFGAPPTCQLEVFLIRRKLFLRTWRLGPKKEYIFFISRGISKFELAYCP